MEYLLFIISCIVIVKSADLLVDSASSLALHLKVPKMIIALTIVAFGTCAPEIGISFSSVMSGKDSMALANVVGSCIVNILLIIGLACFFHPMRLRNETVKKELPLLVFITSIFSFLVLDNLYVPSRQNYLSRSDGIILFLLFCIFVFYLISVVRKRNDSSSLEDAKYGMMKGFFYLVISIFLIIISSNMLVDNAVIIAKQLDISQKIITMVVIAIGTSLPELVMTIRASKHQEYDMAIGNIIGTNIFNICIVLGLPIVIFGGIKIVDFRSIDMLVILLSTILFYLFSKSDKKLTKIEGLIMLIVFICYYFYILFL